MIDARGRCRGVVENEAVAGLRRVGSSALRDGGRLGRAHATAARRLRSSRVSKFAVGRIGHRATTGARASRIKRLRSGPQAVGRAHHASVDLRALPEPERAQKARPAWARRSSIRYRPRRKKFPDPLHKTPLLWCMVRVLFQAGSRYIVPRCGRSKVCMPETAARKASRNRARARPHAGPDDPLIVRVTPG